MIQAVLGMAAVSAFNLTCDVQGTIRDTNLGKALPLNRQVVLRVDLSSMRWCQDLCRETYPLVRATGTYLVLTYDGDPKEDSFEVLSINRESGRYHLEDRTKDITLHERGFCRPAPFTGFPARKF